MTRRSIVQGYTRLREACAQVRSKMSIPRTKQGGRRSNTDKGSGYNSDGENDDDKPRNNDDDNTKDNDDLASFPGKQLT